MSETATVKDGVNVYVGYLSRCEGETALELRIDSKGQVKKWEVNLYEPPRFFEGFLVGRKWYDAYETTSRICGICSVPHNVSGIKATEEAFGIVQDQQCRDFRKIANMSELNMNCIVTNFILGGPDFFRVNSVFDLAANPDLLPVVKKALKFKRLANDLTDFAAGRETHPISMDVGRMTHFPDVNRIPGLIERLTEAREFAWEMAEVVKNYKFVVPFTRKVDLVAIHDKNEYALNDGKIKSTTGFEITAYEHDEYISNKHVEQSNALHYYLDKDPEHSFMVGPIARVVINWDQLSENARKLGEKYWGDAGWFHENMPLSAYGAHCVEYMHTVDELIETLQRLDTKPNYKEKAVPKAGYGAVDTEAPRGLLHYAFKFDEKGDVLWADIVTPTAHAVHNLERDLLALGPHLTGISDEEATLMVEQVARCYDLCCSCSVHFVDMRK